MKLLLMLLLTAMPLHAQNLGLSETYLKLKRPIFGTIDPKLWGEYSEWMWNTIVDNASYYDGMKTPQTMVFVEKAEYCFGPSWKKLTLDERKGWFEYIFRQTDFKGCQQRLQEAVKKRDARWDFELEWAVAKREGRIGYDSTSHEEFMIPRDSERFSSSGSAISNHSQSDPQYNNLWSELYNWEKSNYYKNTDDDGSLFNTFHPRMNGDAYGPTWKNLTPASRAEWFKYLSPKIDWEPIKKWSNEENRKRNERIKEQEDRNRWAQQGN